MLRPRAWRRMCTCPQLVAVASGLFLLKGLPQSVQQVRLRHLRAVSAPPRELPQGASRHDRREGARKQEHIPRAQAAAAL